MAPAHARDCVAPPRYIQISFDFDWPVPAQNSLAQKIVMQCGEAENLSVLKRVLTRSLTSIGVEPNKILMGRNPEAPVATFDIITKNQSDAIRSVMIPVTEIGFSTVLIPAFQVRGKPIEGSEAIVSFALDEGFISEFGAEVRLHWLADGSPVEQAGKSRYRLKYKDVGKRIEAVLSLLIDNRIVATRKTGLAGPVIMAEKRPVAKNLEIVGDPLVGKKLLANYQFQDLNKDDSEQGSRVLWLRDNFAIAGAKSTEYTVVPDDIGHHISVQVVPRSNDGIIGEPAMVSMASKVEDGLVKLSPQVIDSFIAAPGENTETVNSLEDLLNELKPSVAQPASDEIDNTQSPIGGEIFLTKGFKLSSGTTRQFTGFISEPSNLLSEADFARIEAEFVGEIITIEFLKRALERVNQAYKDAGFDLSRALLPEQTVNDGRVELKLVEVKIGDIQIEGAKHISKSYVLDQLGFEAGDYIALEDFETALRRYNSTNKSKLASELAPGTAYGTTDLFVKVEEPPRVELPTFNIDNYSKGLTNILPQSFSTTVNNLFGIDDEITASVSNGVGTQSLALGISTPIGNNGTNFSANYAGAKTKSITENADLVGYRGNSSSFGLGLSVPLWSNNNWAGFGSISYGLGYSDLMAPITGDMLAESKTHKLVLGMPMSFSDGLTQFSISPTWHLIHAQTEIPETNKWVQKLDTEVSLSQFINPKLTANLGGRLLYTESKTFLNMPDEIMLVGGPGSVRAYQPSESSGYRGYFLTAELRSDVANWSENLLPKWMPNLQPYVFLDHVRAQEVHKKTRRGDMWSGYGAGLTLPSVFDVFSFDTYWASPLDTNVHEDEKKAYKDDLLQFSIKARIDLN